MRDMNGAAIADNFPSSAVDSPIPRKPRQPPSPPGQTPRWFESAEKTEKYTAFQLLREQGFSIEKSAEMIGYAPATGWAIERKIKAFRAEKAQSGASFGFLTEKRIKSAASVVDKFMGGKPVGRVVKRGLDGKEDVIAEGVFPKDSTVLRAAETVLDRQFPKQSESAAPSMSFVQVNLSVLAAGSGAEPALAGILGPSVDVTPIPGNVPSNPPAPIIDGDGI